MRRHGLVQFVLLIAGLAAPALATEASSPVTMQFFAGTSEVVLPNGRSVATADVFLERVLDPARSTVLERVLSPDRKSPGRYQEFLVDMPVDAAKGTLQETERGGAFTGTGTLQGPAWAWTGWSTTSKLPDGTRVESRDALTGDVLRAEKEVYAPGGALQIRMKETYRPIGAEEFERRYYLGRLAKP